MRDNTLYTSKDMTKNLKIGNINLSIPEYSSEVGRAIEALTNAHESGQVKSLIAVWVGDMGVTSAVSGNRMMMPAGAIIAESLASRIICEFGESVYEDEDPDE